METNGNGSTGAWTDTEAGKHLQSRLTETRTLEAIDHLLDRIDTLEQAVDKLGDIMQRGPGMVAMLGDMADESYRAADARGVNIDERLKNVLTLTERLTAPDTMEKIDRLLVLSEQAPGLAAMVGDMVDETYRQADRGGVRLDQRLQVALHMAEKLTAPEMVEKVDRLLDLADQMPGLVAMVVDIMDETAVRALEKGYDPQTLTHVAGVANTALTQARAEHPTNAGGLFSLLRAIRDPDRQKGLGFFLNFLKYFGKNL